MKLLKHLHYRRLSNSGIRAVSEFKDRVKGFYYAERINDKKDLTGCLLRILGGFLNLLMVMIGGTMSI